MGQYLLGKKMPDKDIRIRLYREANAYADGVWARGGDEWERALKNGKAGTVAGAAGGRSFDKRTKRKHAAQGGKWNVKRRRYSCAVGQPAGLSCVVLQITQCNNVGIVKHRKLRLVAEQSSTRIYNTNYKTHRSTKPRTNVT